ncbi:hypothetical protein X798_01749 [Onchocerca flexuosa]|uniref:Uncharacterized protein n=1 Tax=Onchocerca flexuosa TaxID=387005 RepID=A0A238C1K0_9BILA|nr:hypothetical protein X798_01749 [Onchocerca flexuosa]
MARQDLRTKRMNDMRVNQYYTSMTKGKDISNTMQSFTRNDKTDDDKKICGWQTMPRGVCRNTYHLSRVPTNVDKTCFKDPCVQHRTFRSYPPAQCFTTRYAILRSLCNVIE